MPLLKKKKPATVKPDSVADASAVTDQVKESTAASASEIPLSDNNPTPAANPSPARSGPGRPATKPHCLRCGKRLERCKCKDGAMLPQEVTRATEEAKKRAAEPLSEEEAEQLLRFFCWMLGLGESTVAALVTKLSWDEAEEVYSFTEADIRELLPPAHKVLAKYAHKLPSFLRDYRDEMSLGMAFFSVQKAKILRASEIVAAKEKQKSVATDHKPQPQLVRKPDQTAEAPQTEEKIAGAM